MPCLYNRNNFISLHNLSVPHILIQIEKMKLLVKIILLFLLPVFAKAQPVAVRDSLSRLLTTLPDDTNKVNTLYLLAFEYNLTKPDTTFILAQQAYDLSRKLNYPTGQARALNNIATGLVQLGDYAKGLKAYKQARELYVKLKNKQGEATILNNIADLYMQQGDWNKGLETMQECYSIYKSLSNPRASSKPIYFANIGECYYNLHQLDSASLYLNEALPLAKAQKLGTYSTILYTLGDVALAQNNKNQAIVYYQQSIGYSLPNELYIQLYETYYRMAKLFQKTAQIDSSIHYAQLALRFSQKAPYLQGILKSSQFLATSFKGKNDKEALGYYEVAVAAKDSLYSQDKLKQMLSISFEEKQHAQEVEATKIANRNRIRIGILIGILAFFSAVAFGLYTNNRQKQKANTLLQAQKDEIDEKSHQLEKTLSNLKSTQSQLIQSEKLASLGELTSGIAHEIQNPLNFVSNFSELSMDLTKDISSEIHKPNIDTAFVEELLTYLKHNQEKINHHSKRASSIVKGMLEHSRDSRETAFSFPTDINNLVDEYFRLAYDGFRAKDKSFNTEMVSNLDPTIPKIEIIPQNLGRVILNLVNNAFYAVNERNRSSKSKVGIENLHNLDVYQPTVTVTTQKTANAIEIHIKDNGTGMPHNIKEKIFQPFFTTKPSGKGTGLGLSLANDIITKGHSGKLTVESTEGVGSEFVISLPLT